jgi:hypothetical protein
MSAAREVKPETIAKTGNKYLNVILTTLSRKTADDHVPDAVDVLHELMSLYEKESAKTFLGFRTTSRNHTNDATTCISILNQPARETAVGAAIDHLNTLTRIYKFGDLAQLLSCYFSVYPEYLPKCSEGLRSKVTIQDLWQPAITQWIEKFIKTHSGGTGSSDHELLETLSATMPESLAEDYADFLLGQLKATNIHESRKGLYKGWLFAALGKLAGTLPIAKKDLVCKTLRAEFSAHVYDLSIIGLSEALAAYLPPNDLEEVANNLYLYTIRTLPNSLDLFADHLSNTISLYMQKTFSTLKLLEKNYNETDIQRNSVVSFMLKPENVYPFRNGIRALENWLPDTAKLDFLSRMEMDDHFLSLTPIFWGWLSLDKNDNNYYTTRKRFDNAALNAQEQVISELTLETQLVDQLKLLVTENSCDAEMRTNIISILLSELSDRNHQSNDDDIRKGLHQGLVLLNKWGNEKERKSIAKLLQISCHDNPDGKESEAIRMSAGRAAVEVCENLSPADAKKLRDDLLLLLNGANAKSAAEALLIFARKIPGKQLPELMTCLLTRNTDQARLLLTQLHGWEVPMDKTLENTVKLRM